MTPFLLVFIGGGIGSVLRYAIALWLTPTEWDRAGPPFPFATLLVNLVGCVTIGLIAAWCGRREWARSLLMIGVLGGFTTFSSFGLDTVRLFSAGQLTKALWYVGASVGFGLLGAWIAFRVAGPVIE